MWYYLLWALIFSLFVNMVLFVIAYCLKTDKLTDISYALCFAIIAVACLFQLPLTPYRIVLAAMVVVWALRLGGFLLLRIWMAGKDHRFDAIRNNFWSFGKFWVSQGFSVWIILLSTMLALRYEHRAFGWVAILGCAVWLAGLLIESFADAQKFLFSLHKENRTTWIKSGLWRYSRHPNYFGEITVWVGVLLFCCAALPELEIVVGAISPLFIAALLLFVSGIPILEKKADERWGNQTAYQKYKRSTSVLIPWPRLRD